MPRRRETKVLLSLEEVRAAFEQQNALAVKDALGVIHEAQFLMGLEPNVVAVPQRASTYGTVPGTSCRFEPINLNLVTF